MCKVNLRVFLEYYCRKEQTTMTSLREKLGIPSKKYKEALQNPTDELLQKLSKLLLWELNIDEYMQTGKLHIDCTNGYDKLFVWKVAKNTTMDKIASDIGMQSSHNCLVDVQSTLSYEIKRKVEEYTQGFIKIADWPK